MNPVVDARNCELKSVRNIVVTVWQKITSTNICFRTWVFYCMYKMIFYNEVRLYFFQLFCTPVWYQLNKTSFSLVWDTMALLNLKIIFQISNTYVSEYEIQLFIHLHLQINKLECVCNVDITTVYYMHMFVKMVYMLK